MRTVGERLRSLSLIEFLKPLRLEVDLNFDNTRGGRRFRLQTPEKFFKDEIVAFDVNRDSLFAVQHPSIARNSWRHGRRRGETPRPAQLREL